MALRVARDYLRPFAGKMAIAVVAALAVAGSTSVIAYMMKPAANDVLRGNSAVVSVALTLIALAVVRAGAQIVQSWTMNTVGHRIVGRIQVDLFGRIIHSDLARLRAAHSGTFVSAMLYDAGLLRNAATNALLTYFQNAVMVVGLVVVMLIQDAWLTLGILLVGPLLGILMERFTRWSKAAAIGAMKETSSLSTAIMEGIDGVKVVKIDNREDYEQARVAAAVDRRQAHIISGANIGAALIAGGRDDDGRDPVRRSGLRLVARAREHRLRRRLHLLPDRVRRRGAVAAPARQPADGVRRGPRRRPAAVRVPRYRAEIRDAPDATPLSGAGAVCASRTSLRLQRRRRRC